MKFIIFTLLIAITTQQTIFSQLSCSNYNCSCIYQSCFNENNTDCKTYGETSIKECGADTIEILFMQIANGKAFSDPAAATDTEACMLEKKEYDIFSYWANCLVECASIIPQNNSLVGLQSASIEAASEQYTACDQDEECDANLTQIVETEACKQCEFLPQTEKNWNMPLTNTDAYCFAQCYSSNNTENQLLKNFFDANDNLFDGIEFVNDEDEKEENNGEKKVLELIIAFILKIFAWFFK